MAAVTFRDETPTGKRIAEWELTGLPDRMTVRELIALRVREETTRHHAHPGDHFTGLVRPEDAEPAPNGHRLPEPRPVDPARQTEAAENAFLTNGFFVLSDDRQLESLDETVDLTPGPTLVFVKLVALVGG
ncbi:hypothetical protein [Streptomyces sp. JHA26]|uniref:hypothetical protein n=1 Tax=Streptomyces sp. JHA26 TaxID=1917143 RepID=UPI00098BA1F9|nr:hypothetical protein [Streptomyces sp. JHA26]